MEKNEEWARLKEQELEEEKYRERQRQEQEEGERPEPAWNLGEYESSGHSLEEVEQEELSRSAPKVHRRLDDA
jgi:hypothetical protein